MEITGLLWVFRQVAHKAAQLPQGGGENLKKSKNQDHLEGTHKIF